MKINELMIKENKNVLEIKLLESYNKIINYGQVAMFNIYNLALEIKKINDEKLFKVLRYKSLEEFTEENFNIKKSQAYKYISIAEKITPETFQLTGKNPSIEKLSLLASLDNEDTIKEVIKEVKIEDTSITDLKKLVDSLKKEKEDLSNKLKNQENTIEELKREITIIETTSDDIETNVVEKENEALLNDFNNTIKELEKKSKLLESKEIELQNIKEKLNKNSDINYVLFKNKLIDLKNIIDSLKDILPKLSNEDKEKGLNAIKVLVGDLNEK